jgi:enoyl-CoA hydratase
MAGMREATVLAEQRGATVLLTLNRPDVLNAIDLATMRLLGDEVKRAHADPAVRVLVITGAGERAFSAGGDIREMTTQAGLGSDGAMAVWQDTLFAIENGPKPVIAAIHGHALGGGTELAMACQIRTAGESAILGQPEIALDHLPGAGGTQRLPRLIALGPAFEYLLTGDPIPAAEAHRLGLVNHVWPDGELLDRTLALAARIGARSPTAVRLSLDAIRFGLQGTLEAGLRLERSLAALALESDEAQQGLRAFLARGRKA